MMGGATWEANGGGTKGVRGGQGATWAKNAVHEWSEGVKMRCRDPVCSQVWAGAGYNQARGQCMNERWCTPFPHPHAL